MELLAPGGSLEKLKYALYYGADAVYASGKEFGLRAQSKNLTDEEIETAVELCHKLNKKLYITINIFAHNHHLDKMPHYFEFLNSVGIDGLIISDPGVFSLAQQFAPHIPIHISTQANVTSWKSAEFWHKQGVKRIILARELTKSEIVTIREKNPALELEIFVHGAQCMAYSGRCLLSAFLNNRHANLGNCSHPCRWKYNLVEETRPGESFPVEEDKYGCYILNSKDLCLLSELEEIAEAQIDSIKIEGRMKSVHYVAVVTRTYREALNCIAQGKTIPEDLSDELSKISHRPYTKGFFASEETGDMQFTEYSQYIRTYEYLSNIIQQKNGRIYLEVKAKFYRNDSLELLFPNRTDDKKLRIESIYDEENNQIEYTKPNTIVSIPYDKKIPGFGIVRKKKNEV